MAEQMGVGAASFVTLHHDDIHAMQRRFGEYIKDLQRLKDCPIPLQGAKPSDNAPKLSIQIAENGFPVVPDLEFAKFTKEELEHLMRRYLSMHYSMFLYSIDAREF
jgi:hypothetical protein